jgi:CubicO group peptidase (beta-lactamase class C family)
MTPRFSFASFLIFLLAVQPTLPAAGENDARWAPVPAAMKQSIDRQLISGAVTLIATKDRFVALDPVGLADVAKAAPMKADTIFAIASMTKLVNATAVMMLQDDGKLSVDDPVGKYVPELAHLKTADGVEHVVTLKQMLTHTSGMGEMTADEAATVHSLADMIPLYAKKPLGFVPGTQWVYCQSGVNTTGRIIEILSGQPYEEFLRKRLFEPLGMKDTTFYPTADQLPRIAKSYKRKDGKLEEAPNRRLANYDPALHSYPPIPAGGLFSTAPDFARMCQMVLNQGEFNGTRLLKPQTIHQMITNQIGPIQSKHVPGSGFGLGWCVVEDPQGQTAPLSPGSAGHGGAFGTWAWIDPQKGLIYILMIQRADFGGKKDNLRDIFMEAVGTALRS